jgi:hypothetical protein
MARSAKPAAGENHNANDYDKYVQELEAKLAMYEQKEIEKEDEELNISQTDYVKVVSLLPYRLNLCTREKGQGRVYRFDKFGQVKRIIYSDLADIIEVNRGFLEAGYFIILNPKVIRLHGLDDISSSILTKEKIEQIVEGMDDKLALYSSANKEQQELIVELFINKLVSNPDKVDLNMVDKLSRLSGVNIPEKAQDAKAILGFMGKQ